MKRYLKGYSVPAAVALVVMLVYLPALMNDFVTWDDNEYVYENPFIRSFDAVLFKKAFFSFFANNWHPLTWMSHALDYALWGLNPLGHHLTSIILHSINVFLVVMLATMLLNVFKRGRGEDVSFLNDRSILIAAGTTGLLFGLHPLHVESVAWVAERKDLLCALFFLLSIMMYTKFAEGKGTGDKVQDAVRIADNTVADGKIPFLNRYYLASLGLFSLALLSKPMAVTLPIVLLILDWLPFGRIRSLKTFLKAFVDKFPFIVLSIASSIMTLVAQGSSGAMKSLVYAPFVTRLIVAAHSLIAYLGKMILPLRLVPYYPYSETGMLASFHNLASIVLIAGITAGCVMIVRKHKIWPAAWAYYCVTLIPVLGLVQVGTQSMADRYTYLPSLGPFLVAGLGVAWVWDKVQMSSQPYIKRVSVVAAVCIVLFLAITTVKQTGIWKNGIVLWSAVVEKYPGIAFAYDNRGMAYDKMGNFDKAVEDFSKAISLDPNNGEVYSNRGMVFGKTGRLDKAIEDLEKAISLKPPRIAVYNIRNTLGVVYAQAGLTDKAFEQFNAAILLDQEHTMAFNNRGLLYVMTGDIARASLDYRKACDLGDSTGCNALNELSRRGASFQ